MPAKSQAQQKFFGMLHANPEMAAKRGIDMTPKQIKDFASTKRKGLPMKVHKPRK
jgi:hypothetical protein